MEDVSRQLEKPTAATREKMVALVNKLQAEILSHREKEDALLGELCAILGGMAGLGPRLNELKALWCELWQGRHHEPCAFDNVAHSAGLKKKMLAYGDDIVRAKMANYLATEESYYLKARHPFGLFLASFDTWRGIPLQPEATSETTSRLQAARGE